ncbi:hypothetical protein BpHYR1_040235 [Brachionus plicatilis]|uniref:Uncharacterized protein n=1 Tax=Brachionus plicatilis TaxID=10195 RepID=A0A3M7PBE4_BRAPC|nr:hypothetical protein BpHYR1_040235 [Brachionus plicatilis]
MVTEKLANDSTYKLVWNDNLEESKPLKTRIQWLLLFETTNNYPHVIGTSTGKIISWTFKCLKH